MSEVEVPVQPALNNWNPALGDETTSLIKQSLGDIQNQMPFLIGLTTSQRLRLAKVGDRTRPFVSDAVQAAIDNPGVVPRSVNIEELRSKANTLNNLRDVQMELRKLDELLADTQTQLGSELYGLTRSVYSVLKTSATPPGLSGMKDTLGQRFKRKKNRQIEQTNPSQG